MSRYAKWLRPWTIATASMLLPISLLWSAENPSVPLRTNNMPGQNSSMTGIHQNDIHIIQDATTLITDETTLHMDGARLADTKKDYKAAADELRRVQAHVESQLTALQNADHRLSQLIADTQNGKVSPSDLNQAFMQVRQAMDRTHQWVPLASEEVDVFMPEMDYHLNRARQEWKAGDNKTAAKDIWTAVSYLRLRQDALKANKANRRESLHEAEKNLSALATTIGSHNKVSNRTFDSDFLQASTAWNGSF